jgi:NADH:ubiquinone oxidoreductase subunit E
MPLTVLDINDTVHPLRHELDREQIKHLWEAIQREETWMSLEEVEAVADMVHDHVVAQSQTVEGVLTVQ